MAYNYNPLNDELVLRQAMTGGQDYLRIFHAGFPTVDPTGGVESNMGLQLINVLLQPSSTYYCSFPMNGMNPVNINIQGTFSGGTVTIAAYSTFKDHQTQDQAFTGTGALTTNTLQTSTLSTPKGEQVAIVQIVTGAGLTPFSLSRAEYNGQRA